MVSLGDINGCAAMVDADPVNFRVSRKALTDRLIDVDVTLLRPVPETNAALHLLTSHMRVIEDGTALPTPDLQRMVSTHLQNLIALMPGGVCFETGCFRS